MRPVLLEVIFPDLFRRGQYLHLGFSQPFFSITRARDSVRFLLSSPSVSSGGSLALVKRSLRFLGRRYPTFTFFGL